MAVSYRFIHNLETVTEDVFFLIQARFLQSNCEGSSFSSKVKIRGMTSRLSELIPEQTVQKEMLQNFQKIKIYGGICNLNILNMYSFADVLKMFHFFKKFFRLVNENTDKYQ